MPRGFLAVVTAAALVTTACASLTPEELAERYPAPDLANLRLDDTADEPDAESNDHGGAGGVDIGPLSDDGSPEGRAPRDEPLAVEWDDCSFDPGIYSVECGSIEIPSETPGVDPVTISFARFQAHASDVHADPVVYLHGGPGGAVLESAPLLAPSIVDPFIDTRDVVLYDQRGAGESSPLPVCREAWGLDDRFFASAEPHADVESAYLASLRRCGERVERRDDIALNEYNSTVNADDLLDLIRALGYGQVNLYGNSYGTRLAQTMLRDHPEPVRSVILSGVYPIEENLIGSVPEAFRSGLDVVFDLCTADPECRAQLPDPWATFGAVVDDLDADPIEIEVYAADFPPIPLLIGGDDLINLLHGLLYSADGAALIPDLLTDIEDGNTHRLGRVGPDAFYDTASVLGFMAVECREEAPFTTANERAEAERFDTPWHRVSLAPGLVGPLLLDGCELFPSIGSALPLENEAVSWSQPTLILSGGYDPITPPWWAASVAERLPNATLASFQGRGHDADEGWCAYDLMRSFVFNPENTLDTSCIDEVAPLALTNTPEILVSPLEAGLQTSPIDLGDAPDIEMLVPDWFVDRYTTELAYWRNLDLWDRTIIVVRGGDWAPDEITWYLDDSERTSFRSTDTPPNVSSRWERLVFETGGTDAVSYVIEEDGFTMNVSVIGSAGEIAQLERAILHPMIESIPLP